MGQRTAIIIKRNFADGSKRIDMLHEQWGLGKIMPLRLMRDLINLIGYDNTTPTKNNYNPTLKEQIIYREPKKYCDYIVDCETWDYDEEGNSYIAKFHSPDIDIWNLDNIRSLFSITDNNNGGMIIEVTEKCHNKGDTFDKLCKPKDYYDEWLKITDIKVGFVKGREDTDTPFAEIVTAEEYMKQWEDCYMPEITEAYNNLCKAFEITQVTTK